MTKNPWPQIKCDVLPTNSTSQLNIHSLFNVFELGNWETEKILERMTNSKKVIIFQEFLLYTDATRQMTGNVGRPTGMNASRPHLNRCLKSTIRRLRSPLWLTLCVAALGCEGRELPSSANDGSVNDLDSGAPTTPPTQSDAGTIVHMDAGNSATDSGMRADSGPVLFRDAGLTPFDAGFSQMDAGANLDAGFTPYLVQNFALLDVNPTSSRFNTLVSPGQLNGQVSAWYFGHAT